MNNGPNSQGVASGIVANLLDFQALSMMDDKQIQDLFGIRDIFFQEMDIAALNAGATTSNSFTIQNDANFLWQAGTYMCNLATPAGELTEATNIVPEVGLTLLDQTSGRQLSQTYVPIPNMFGRGELPFILPTPRFFRANTQVTFNFLNYGAENYINLKLTMIGTKFFKFAQPV